MKAESGYQRAEFYDAVLDETDNTHTTLKYTIDGKSVKVQMGIIVNADSNPAFTPVEFTDDMKNTNGRYEVACQSGIQNYYLKVVNDENADYKLAVAGKHYKDRNF